MCTEMIAIGCEKLAKHSRHIVYANVRRLWVLYSRETAVLKG
jgi:hypothetical protein